MSAGFAAVGANACVMAGLSALGVGRPVSVDLRFADEPST
jgi:hypothetical protein